MRHPRIKQRYWLEMFYDDRWNIEVTSTMWLDAKIVADSYPHGMKLRIKDSKLQRIVWEVGQ